MTKNITSGMQTHLSGTVTSLAMCWKVTRVDLKEFRFTTHDRDLIIDGCVYDAETGYNQTAVQNDSSLAVDNLEVEGILDSDKITEIELRAGIFNFATIEVFLVNWQNLSDGKINLRKGKIGEVTITPTKIFRAELRGLTQQYAQQIVEMYSPECRADLGDSRCKIPLNPDIRADLTACVLGDFIRVATAPSVGRYLPLPIINHSFETGDLTGWTTVAGTPLVTGAAGIDPLDGAVYLRGTATTGSYEVSQDIDITEHAVAIDAGDLKAYIEIWRGFLDVDADDTVQIIVEARTVADAFISNVFDSGAETQAQDDRYYKRGGYFLSVPATARTLRIRLIASAVTDTTASGVFDFTEIGVVDTSPSRETFDHLIYNLDFEVGDDTDWTTVQGTFNLDNSDQGLVVSTKQWFFRPVDEAFTEIETELDLTTDIEILTADIDNDLYLTELDYLISVVAPGQLDTMKITLDAIDTAGDVIETLYIRTHTGTELAEDVWTLIQSCQVDLPANTRTLRINVLCEAVTGARCNVVLDDIDLRLKLKQPTEGQEIYENRIYECTSAGTTGFGIPVYDTTVSNTTSDGSAVFTAVEAWTRDADVATVTDKRVFTINVVEPLAVDDWFTYGVISFLTGDNRGLSIEIKDWVNATSEISLFLLAPFAIQVGDKLKLYPGCDKRKSTCITKFDNIINFRGEPYVPGQDAYLQTPNAR